MKRYLSIPSLVTVGLFSFSAAASLNVLLPTESIELKYETPVRLDVVLKDSDAHSTNSQHLKSSNQSYSLANQLFNINKQQQANELKQEVLAELAPLKNSTNNETREFAYSMIQQVKSWDIGYRETVSLDYDYVRIAPSANPMLEGDYQLITPSRPNSVVLEGLFFASPQQVAFSSQLDTSELVSDMRKLKSAHNSYAWVIYPDGHYQRVGFAYWNKEDVHLAPGSVIYLGLNSDSHQMVSLEEKIVQLITMRKAL